VSDEHRARRREEFLRAAWRCFARSGVHAVTMDQISAEAGASAGAIYLYFPSKDDLIRTAIGTSTARFGRLAEIGPRRPLAALPDILAALDAAGVTPDGIDLFVIAVQGWAFSRTDAPAAELLRTAYRGILAVWAASGEAAGLSADAARAEAEAVGCIVLGAVAQRALLGTPDFGALAAALAATS
jgi:AcrR family transcriptional regulator